MGVSYFTAPDGARLAFRDEGEGLPVLCLTGLTRNMADFDFVAPHLSDVRMIRMDYRGRGLSDFTGAETYTILHEAKDAIALLDHLGIDRAALIGTSRGGLIGMTLAAIAKDRLRGICFNDIGPDIDRGGMARIADYVGRNPVAKTLHEAARRMPDWSPGFLNVPHARWLDMVGHLYDETSKGLVIRYDPALRDAVLAALALPPIDLWPLFDACSGLPLALIRGKNSDLLSPGTADEMSRRRPDMIRAEVADRAHVPFLDEPEARAALREWLGRMA